MTLINLNRKLNTLDKGNPKRSGRSKHKVWLIRVVIILVILFVAVYLPARGVYTSAQQASIGGKRVVAALKQENLDEIKKGVIDTRSSVDSLNGALNWFFWLRFIPFAGGYYSDAKHFTIAASSELKAAQTVVESLEPYKQELGFLGKPAPGQDKIAQAVKVLDKVLPNIDKIEPDLKKAREEAQKIDTSKYPEKYGKTQVRSKVEQLKNFIIGAHIAVSENKAALEVAPEALGQVSPKTYLLLFQNDKELRPTGGFITAYAFLKLDKGHLSTTISDDIYHLDEKLLITCRSKICPLSPPKPIVKYLPEFDGKPRSAWSMRDSNLSPDLSVSAKEFERMYEMLGEGIPFDGIITIDTQVVEELIAVIGPIEIFGTNYSAETDKRCNCPNVIYELEHYAEIASKGGAERKAILGTLMQQILTRALSSGPDKLPDFVNTGIRLANDKHLMFYMHDAKTQEALRQLNWTGEIRSSGGDYLLVNDSNFAGGKSNLYVGEKVTYDIKVSSDGTVKNQVNIEYKNPQAFNTWLNGILRDYVRLYVPKGSQLISSKGSDDPVNTIEDTELNKTYFEAFITVRPQNSRTLSFEYTLPNKIQGKTYPLLIQKQPGAKDHHYIIKINGSKKAEFDLITDQELTLNF